MSAGARGAGGGRGPAAPAGGRGGRTRAGPTVGPASGVGPRGAAFGRRAPARRLAGDRGSAASSFVVVCEAACRKKTKDEFCVKKVQVAAKLSDAEGHLK